MSWNPNMNSPPRVGMPAKNTTNMNTNNHGFTGYNNSSNQQFVPQSQSDVNQLNGPPINTGYPQPSHMNRPPGPPMPGPPYIPSSNTGMRPPVSYQQLPQMSNNLNATHPPPSNEMLSPSPQMMRSNSAPNMPPVAPGQPPKTIVNGHPSNVLSQPPSNVVNGPQGMMPPLPPMGGPQGLHNPVTGPNGQIINNNFTSSPNTAPVRMNHPGYKQNPNITAPPINGPPPRLPTVPMGYQPTGVQGPPQAANLCSRESERPSELPVPYHGQAQYSTQVHHGLDPNVGLTPGSEPASQKSSRGPSPVPTQNYDALEGQFSSGQRTPVKTPTQPGMPTMPPQSGGVPGMSPQLGSSPGMLPPHQAGLSPPQSTGGPGMPPPQPGSGPSMLPPQSIGSHGMPPLPPSQPGSGPYMSPLQPGVSQPAGLHQPPAMGPSTLPPSVNAPPGTGIAGKRVYPQMPSYQPVTGAQSVPPPPGSQHQPINSSPGMPSGMPQQTFPPQPNIPPQPQPNVNQSQHPGNYMAPNSAANMANNFSQMSLQSDATRPINLLQEKKIIPLNGIETCVPNLPADYKKVNCHPDVFRCTLNAIPNSQSLLSKSRLPLGILIHPFKDLSQLPVIQSSVIVRCRSCRTYINPFVSFMDSRRWKCNLCYRVNELPEEFSYDPVSKTYGDPQRRPEIRSATIEFIAPSEYMLRPPQPAVYLYVLDVSFNARETGYLEVFCQTVLDELDRIPGDSRTQIGFITYDRSLHFYNLQEGLSQPQMMIVSDVDDVFLPLPEGLLVNLSESKELITDLLNTLPSTFQGNLETGSALGPALQASYKLLSSTGGRVSVFQTQLPSVGPGSLKNREDPNERAGKKVQNLGPAIDFYKKLALDCSAQQIAVDVFMLNAQYADLATIAGISKYSGGCFHYFPGLHTKSNPTETDRFEGTLRRYLTRKIGFESVMRIRCSRGLSIHTFHGNFFVRSTDLLSLPNINPDTGFGMQMSIEDNIETNYVCFQAALLYTSSKGERRIRVHTLCIPVTNSIIEVFSNADQVGICALLSKMAVDKSLTQSMGDARDALVNSCVDMLSAYGTTLTSSQRMGQLPCPYSLRLMPLYVLALLKHSAFKVGSITKLDDRVFALESCKTMPISQIFQDIYPSLYPVHNLDDKECLSKGDSVIPQPGQLQLSAGNMDRHGAYLMDLGGYMYIWLGAAVSDKFCQEILDVPTFQSVPEGMTELPELDNAASERLRSFLNYLNDSRPFPSGFHVIREDSRTRTHFIQHLVDDRSESTFSYYEFLQHLQKEVK